MFPVRIAFALVLCLMLCAPVRAQGPDWVDNDDMLLFYEALTRITEQSIYPENSRDMVHKAIRGYLAQLDNYSDYLTPEQYAAYERSQNKSYAGVGMDIFADHYGRIICLPYPGGPAERAGVRYGDVLVFVDDTSVREQPVPVVGSLIRGVPGGSVRLTLERDGVYKNLSLVRQAIEAQDVVVAGTSPFPVVRILTFTASTADNLHRVLKTVGTDRPKVLDLRGNTGGDLYAAIDAAALFLDSGKKIVDFRTQDSVKSYATTGAAVDRSALVIWQDGLTASAAEVFIAALVQNGRAESVGTTTFGKGVAQTVVKLSDGSVIFVTNGSLKTPSGDYYHKHGLKPGHEVAAPLGGGDVLYRSKTDELARSGVFR